MKVLARSVWAALALAVAGFLVPGVGAAQTRLVISQMYGGGGNTGAQFTNDFVELYNPTAAAISLNGLSLQYAPATSASWNSVPLPSVAVQPGKYFLIADSFYDPSRLILDAGYNRAQVTAGVTVQPVAAKAANEFTVASYNVERFYNSSSTDDLYYVPAGVNGYNGNSSTPAVSTGQTFQSVAVDVTAAAYARRLQKTSLAIRTVLNSPDIITLEEVENQSVAVDIATQVNTDAGVPNLYTA